MQEIDQISLLRTIEDDPHYVDEKQSIQEIIVTSII